MPFCSTCGRRLPESALHCPSCGAAVVAVEADLDTELTADLAMDDRPASSLNTTTNDVDPDSAWDQLSAVDGPATDVVDPSPAVPASMGEPAADASDEDWERFADLAGESLRLEIEGAWGGLRGEIVRSIDETVRDGIAAAGDRGVGRRQQQQRQANTLLGRLRQERGRVLAELENLRREVTDRRRELTLINRERTDAESRKARVLQDIEHFGRRLETLHLEILHSMTWRPSATEEGLPDSASVPSQGPVEAGSPAEVETDNAPTYVGRSVPLNISMPADVEKSILRVASAASGTIADPVAGGLGIQGNGSRATRPLESIVPESVVGGSFLRPSAGPPAATPAPSPIEPADEPATDPLDDLDLPEPPDLDDLPSTSLTDLNSLLGLGSPPLMPDDEDDRPPGADALDDLLSRDDDDPELSALDPLGRPAESASDSTLDDLDTALAPLPDVPELPPGPIVTTLRIGNVSGLARAMQLARAIRTLGDVQVQGAPRFQNGTMTLAVEHELGYELADMLTSAPGLNLTVVDASSPTEMEFSLTV